MLQFGVSGLLYESNLLMYDTKTESLWSQARGEAVVGEYLGEELDILQIQLLTFEEMSQKYPNVLVLSEDTGHSRNYGANPYSGYLESRSTIFPVSHSDDRFFAKELFYIIPIDGTKIAFPYRQFEEGEREFSVAGREIQIQRRGGEIYVTDLNSEEGLPGYFELWFSFITQNTSNHIILEV